MDHWLKSWAMILELESLLEVSFKLNRQRLLEIRGFLNYVGTYMFVRVMPQGLHMTIVGHRSDRDSDGWKYTPWEQAKFWGEGIWDANFKRGEFEPYGKAWHGKCLNIMPRDWFTISRPSDEEGFWLISKEDERRHLHGQDGDHLMVAFQYKVSHFWTLLGRDLQKEVVSNQELLIHIRSASLDSFWAREPSTVGKNWGGLEHGARHGSEMGIRESFFPPYDNSGSIGIYFWRGVGFVTLFVCLSVCHAFLSKNTIVCKTH